MTSTNGIDFSAQPLTGAEFVLGVDYNGYKHSAIDPNNSGDIYAFYLTGAGTGAPGGFYPCYLFASFSAGRTVTLRKYYSQSGWNESQIQLTTQKTVEGETLYCARPGNSGEILTTLYIPSFDSWPAAAAALYDWVHDPPAPPVTFDKNSFLAGLAVGRQLRGWGFARPAGEGEGGT